MVAGEIATTLDIQSTNLSFHLKTMTQALLVTVEQEGRFQRYRANLPLMLQTVALSHRGVLLRKLGAMPAPIPRGSWTPHPLAILMLPQNADRNASLQRRHWSLQTVPKNGFQTERI